jgi:hypothetical protein
LISLFTGCSSSLLVKITSMIFLPTSAYIPSSTYQDPCSAPCHLSLLEYLEPPVRLTNSGLWMGTLLPSSRRRNPFS